MKFLKKSQLVAFAALIAAAPAAIGKPGSLDRSFNSTGIVTSGYGSWAYTDSVAIMPDGRIVVAGTDDLMGEADIVVMRYLPNGTLDKTLAGSGGVVTDVGGLGGVDAALAVAVQPDGKILVAGFTRAVDQGAIKSVVIRYNPDGSLDTSFATGGQIISDSPTGEMAKSIIVLSSGKILVGGRTNVEGGGFRVTRYNSDGSQDPTFAGNGRMFGSSATDSFNAMAVQPDGKIVMAGSTIIDGDSDFAVIRLTADGEPDATFDGDGYLRSRHASWSTATVVKIQPDGKILVGGSVTDASARRFLGVARYTTSGSPDTSFSKDGLVTHDFGSVQEATGMLVQNDGEIVLVGWLIGGNLLVDSYPGDIAMVRMTPSGDPDKTFGTNGQVHTELGLHDRAYGAALQPDGKVVVVGGMNANFALSRYNMEDKADALVGSKSSATGGNNIYNSNGAGQSLDLTLKRAGGKKISFVRIQNDSIFPDAFTVKGTAGNSAFNVRYLKGGKNVTSQVTAGTLKTGSLAPGAGLLLQVEITARTKVARKTRNFTITGRSATDSSSTDTVLIKAKSK